MTKRDARRQADRAVLDRNRRRELSHTPECDVLVVAREQPRAGMHVQPSAIGRKLVYRSRLALVYGVVQISAC